MKTLAAESAAAAAIKMKNAVVIYNRNSGRKEAAKSLKDVRRFLSSCFEQLQITEINDITTVDFNSFDTFIIIGGDGTINRCLPFLDGKYAGIIPCGTANLLAARLGIFNTKSAIRAIKQEKTKEINICTVNNKQFILRCGTGYDSNIICHTPQKMKNLFGYFSYVIAGMLFALRLRNKKYTLKTNNQNIEADASCIIIANAPNMYKNLFKIGSSKLDEALFDVFILKTENSLAFFVEFLKILCGIRKSSQIADYFKTEEITLKSSFIHFHCDGEKSASDDELDFKFSTKKLKIFTP